MADNFTGIEDEDGNRNDWIELQNTGTTHENLEGWWLSDDAANPRKWQFPAVSLPPGGILLVWASGKDRRIAGKPLHTSFSLAKSGEYLGLHRPESPGSSTPVPVSEFSPTYPAQTPDISYGIGFQQTKATLLPSGATVRYRVLANNATGQTQYSGTSYASGHVGTHQPGGWNVSPSFDDRTWTQGATGIGYDTSSTFLPLVGTSPSGNCQSAMRNVNPSILIRCPFTVPDPSAYASYTLRIKYEDGFVAFVNGTQVAAANNPGSLTYNATAPVALTEAIVNSWTEFSIPASLIVPGANVLAIQGLNSSSSSSDFVILPEVAATSGTTAGTPAYFSIPSPGAVNNEGTTGPLLFNPLPADPLVPRPTGNALSPPLTVSVNVIATRNAVSVVRAYYRAMFNAEASVLMRDDGTFPDALAGDGMFTANLPTSSVGPAQMFRWRFEALDSTGSTTRLPAHPSPTDSPRYFGTVATSTLAINSSLPVLEWFVENAPNTGPTAAAFRGSCYYLGYFYDNTGHEIHGQSTSGMPKKSYDFDSNTGYRFLWKEGERRVKDLNVLSNYADKTKTRNTLSHEVGNWMGAPYHFCHPIRMHLNGAFFGLMDLMEDGDDRLLERNGLDPDGAFYKIYAETMNASPEKKTRKTEDNSDLTALTTALDPTLPLATRRTWGYDNIDIAATVNYLVLRQLNSDADHGHKNYYLYRDTNVTGEWMPIVWDVDLSQGHQWNGNNGTLGYFNDTLVTNNPLNRHSSNNRLYNLILESPEFQQMFARRMRTAMDSILQPPGTIRGRLESRMRELAASVDPDPADPSPQTDGDLDHARWGMNSNFIDNKPREEVERVVYGYYAPRRQFLFDTSASRPLVQKPGLTGGTPLPSSPQTAGPKSVTIDSLDYYPGSGSQADEYLILRNTLPVAVDLTGWRLRGAIDHAFTPGTVIPSGAGTAAVEYRGLLHVVKDARAFRARSTGPKGGEKRFIQGNYSGQLSSRGETIELIDERGNLIHSLSYAGNPTPAQQFLRISEIHFHPSAPTPSELTALPGVLKDEFEFIELLNTGTIPLELGGVKFTAGITYQFPAQSLQPGQRVVVAKRPEAFLLRHPEFKGTPGTFEGNLDNSGERIELTDASGEVVCDFTYDDQWHPVTDGGGLSLVLRDPHAPNYQPANPEEWAMSPDWDGSPGTGDGFATLTLANLLQEFTGKPLEITAHTTPASLPVAITYNGSSLPPIDPGTYVVEARIAAPNYDTVTTATLEIRENPYQQWQSRHFSAQEIATGLADPARDADADGQANHFEFAFGGNPRNGSTNAAIHWRLNANPALPENLELILAVRSGTPAFTGSPSPSASIHGISYRIEATADLTTFLIPVREASQSPANLPPLPEGYEYRTFTIDPSAGIEGNVYFRARIDAVP